MNLCARCVHDSLCCLEGLLCTQYGNLRQRALARMRDFGTKCRDVRTREVGIQEIHHKVRPDQVELVRRDYTANGGWETFLAYEDPQQDILVGLLRLRKCSPETFRPELKGNCSIVRELHVYGSAVPIHARDPTKFQHQVRRHCKCEALFQQPGTRPRCDYLC